MAQAALSETKGFRCLIADDSVFARKSIAQVIEKIGGQVVAEAVNGLQAIEYFETYRPDVVLLDITMPLLDGVETLRKIIERDKDAKVIIVSSIGHKEMVWRAICLGARCFVTKPYDPAYAGRLISDIVGETGQTVK